MNEKFTVLAIGKLKSGNGKSKMQDLLLSQSPFMVYPVCPFLVALFLLNPASQQFIFCLLPTENRHSFILKILAASLECYITLMWLASAHFADYHELTCLRVVEEMLLNAVKGIKYVNFVACCF